MTTLAPSTTSTPSAPGAQASIVDRFGAANLVLLGITALAFLSVFFRWLLRQHEWSFNHFEDWGHAYIVPLISGAYVWQRRKELALLPLSIFAPGLAVMLLGIPVYVFFLTGYPNHMFQGFALILSLAGLCLFLLGPSVFQALVFPLAYLGFAVTISEMVMLKITFELRKWASQGAWALLNLVGFDTDINGNILEIHNGGSIIPLNVADACAGMRMVVAFVALAVAVAFLSCRLWWHRIAVCMLAIPVALLMNVVRVAVLGAASLANPDLASGGAHMFIGTLLLIPSFFLFMGCVWLLKQAERRPVAKKKGARP